MKFSNQEEFSFGIVLFFGESKKRVSLILRSWALCSRDGEIPLLVITMLFSYKGRGTRQIWSSLCLGTDAQLSDLTWDIVQHSPTCTTRQQPQSFRKLLKSCFLELLSQKDDVSLCRTFQKIFSCPGSSIPTLSPLLRLWCHIRIWTQRVTLET